MPVTSGEDITLVLSGGTVNLNPNNSLGGDPSSSPIVNNALNNLFSDISSDQSDEGVEDYRCLYFFNDGDTDIYSVSVWIDSDFDGGSTMELGVETRNEIQRVSITGGVVTGGSFTLSYNGHTFVAPYNADLGEWAVTVQDGILGLIGDDAMPIFHDVSVVAQNAGATTIIFDINFSDTDAKRNFDKFVLVEEDLVSVDEINVLISTPQEGAPINTIAPEINFETTPPGGVGFFTTSEASPIELPYLKSGEGFPLWVKRVTPEGTEAKESDGFILSFKAESLPPV